MGLTAAPAFADTTPTAPGEPETVTSVPLPTAQIDGVAWTQAIAGNTVFVGGEFTTARPAGAAAGVNTSPRANLMAYTLSTGVMTSWNPGANGAIKSIVASPDGSTVYVGGTFTTIAGVSRSRIAAFNAATGAILPWNPAANGPVSDIAVRGTTVWLGGDFSYVGGASRVRIASVSASTAKALPFTATLAGGYGVRAVVVDPSGSKVVVAGSFESANGSTNPGRGMAALDAVSGATVPWAVNSLIRNAGTKAAMYSLYSDGDSVYGTGYDFGGGPEDGFEGVFRANWSDGSLVWLQDCHGDDYSVAVSSGVVYSASHDHYCGNVGGFPQTNPNWTFHHSLAFSKDYLGNTLTPDIYGYKSYAGQPAGTLLNWFPDWQVGSYTGKSQAAWDIATNDDYVLYGGEFLKINNIAQQGLVRFAKKGIAPDTDGPRLTGTGFPVTALSIRAGEVRLSWSANWDRDNTRLTYQLYREGTAAPIYETTADSNFWTLPDLRFVDKTVEAGKTYQYRVRAIDPDGNAAMGAYTSVTASATPASDYALGVLADGAVNYWPLTDTSATTAANWADGSDLIVNSATRGAAGPNLATPSKSTTFGGSTNSFAVSKTTQPGPDTFSVEAWVNTTSTAGGKIVGFGNSKTGDSGSYDRHVYMSGDGRITFGVYPGGVRTVSSAAGFNDGQWHYVVATMGSNGMTLYVDGKRVDGRADTTSGQPYTGYWRVGGDNVGGWPNTGSSNYLSGSISDVAVYDKVISRTQVNDHWVKSGRTSVVPPAPSDAYGAAVYGLSPTLFWRVGEPAGATKALDAALDANQGTYYGDVTKGVSGALSGVSNTGITLNPSGGTQTGISSDASFSNPTTFALETWFKTNSTSGGKILGFGNAQTGLSNNYDRHVYMAPDGTVKFGVWTGGAQIIQSGPGLNDNKWHHVVAQMSSNGMELYIDGALASSSANTQAQDYTGYWRVGGDSGWEGDQYWRGSVDEVAVYPQALTAAQVGSHFTLGAGIAPVNQAPVASFTSSAAGLVAAFDGSASSDAEGLITGYAWDFGDGQTGTGAAPSHTYGVAGTYTVTLTVTDEGGATGSVSHDVTVAPVNQAPTAAFTSAVSGLGASFDGSGSADAEGPVASYAWDFGDGQTGTGATTSHTYAGAGTYHVTLTVTDGAGATGTVGQDVVVAPVNQAPVAMFTSSMSHLAGSFDGNGSSDAEGPVASYAWDFGDGQTGTGATTSHTYAAAGTFHVTLTVTDGAGATGTVTNAVIASLAPVNQAPTAAFTSSVSGLGASVDAAASADPEGPIASYAWNFGDGQTGSGATASHTYAGAGTFTITLTVTDGGGATGSVSHDVTVAPVNQAPTAAFTSAVSGLGASFDGSGSADAEGPVASYAWDFGDGQTGTGATTSHTYAGAGTYHVTLTVTDGAGATGSVAQDVVIVVVSNVIGRDAFERAVANGWGQADVGGSWSIASGSASSFSVADGAGKMTVRSSTGLRANLAAASSSNTRVVASFSVDKIAGGQQITLVGRQVGADNYNARALIAADGTVRLAIFRNQSSFGAAVNVPGLVLTPGTVYTMAFEVKGNGTTSLAAKIWTAADAEPTAWRLTKTDTTAALQAAGGVGLDTFVPSSAGAYPVTVSFTDVTVIDPTIG
ncbi:PKD domain-containing protein [Microbacterium flavum]|nr:PKD domain-containing protein [Microbacterium flavum]